MRKLGRPILLELPRLVAVVIGRVRYVGADRRLARGDLEDLLRMAGPVHAGGQAVEQDTRITQDFRERSMVGQQFSLLLWQVMLQRALEEDVA